MELLNDGRLMKIPYIQRVIPISENLSRKSVLLLGPRRTGKSSLIRFQLEPCRVYNLLRSVDFFRLSARPSLIREEIMPQDKLVCIDEVQKLPLLMDEVHDLIETTDVRFLLTGSSARKLKRNYTSLMAGRARTMHIFPLVWQECASHGTLHERLKLGFLPPVLQAESPLDELKDYTGDYLKEEIQAEALTRNLGGFSRFLSVAAMSNGGLINFEAIASDAQVPARTVREYFGLLEDTLMGSILMPWKTGVHRRNTARGKFYFFDVGVANVLTGRTAFPDEGPDFGTAFEHFFFMELRAYLSYRRKDDVLNFWRDSEGNEIDFIVNGEIGVEIKATRLATERHAQCFARYPDRLAKKILVTRDPSRRQIGDVEIIPWEDFLTELWSGGIV